MISRSESYNGVFKPNEYLKEYYSSVGPENRGLLNFLARAYRDVKPGSTILEAGIGPTIYPLISASRKACEIHVADPLEDNLEEIRKWQREDPLAHDWKQFIYEAIDAEGGSPTMEEVKRREMLLRGKITNYYPINVLKSNPLGKEAKSKYDVVSMHFVAESITSSKEEWEKIMSNVCSMVRPGGTLIMAALREAAFYTIGDRRFRATYLYESDITKAVSQSGFNEILLVTNNAEILDLNNHNYHGYNGMIFTLASNKK